MNRGITVLQTAALATWLCRRMDFKMERANGFEPSTSTLARWHSTAELRPLMRRWGVTITNKIRLSIKKLPSSRPHPYSRKATISINFPMASRYAFLPWKMISLWSTPAANLRPIEGRIANRVKIDHHESLILRENDIGELSSSVCLSCKT